VERWKGDWKGDVVEIVNLIAIFELCPLKYAGALA